MEGYTFKISKELFAIRLKSDSDEWGEIILNNWSHYEILDKVIAFMKQRGFEIVQDTSVKSTTNKNCYWYGIKGDLECSLKRHSRGFNIDFFQNVNGGKYATDKFNRAPYLIKLMWINETNKIGGFLESLGVKDGTNIEYKLAEDKIKKNYVDSSYRPQKSMNFSLRALDGTTCKERYNNADRDGNTIRNGDIKYFRNRNGRLSRGKVYHNINNMWWVMVNDTSYANITAMNLFNANEEDFKVRRKVKGRRSKDYKVS